MCTYSEPYSTPMAQSTARRRVPTHPRSVVEFLPRDFDPWRRAMEPTHPAETRVYRIYHGYGHRGAWMDNNVRCWVFAGSRPGDVVAIVIISNVRSCWRNGRTNGMFERIKNNCGGISGRKRDKSPQCVEWPDDGPLARISSPFQLGLSMGWQFTNSTRRHTRSQYMVQGRGHTCTSRDMHTSEIEHIGSGSLRE